MSDAQTNHLLYQLSLPLKSCCKTKNARLLLPLCGGKGRGWRGKRLLAFLILLLPFPPLHAHNVISGAYVDGMLIEGEIAFSSGETAQPDTLVEIFAPNGEKIGETHTDEEGLFTFTASHARQHIFKANLGAGHMAEITVEADELATTEPVKSAGAETPEQTPATAATAHNVTGISKAELESIVRTAVAQQVKPLHKELRAYKEKVMLRDIAGGLGFIFGLFGVAAWVAARKQTHTSANKPATDKKS